MNSFAFPISNDEVVLFGRSKDGETTINEIFNYKEIKWVRNEQHVLDLEINNTNVLMRQGHETYAVQMT